MLSQAKAAIQKAAPYFEGVAWHKEMKKISLNDFKGKYLCMFFYPLDFTFVCPTEIVEFSEKASVFAQLNCGLLGVSVDSHFSHMEWTKKAREHGGLGEINFPLLSDITKSISRDYGCLLEDAGVACRATYIIDDKGILRHAGINDLPVGRNVDEVIRLVKAFQYTDKHGEVCPASWKEGAPTMKADPNSKLTLDYWKNVHAKKN
mgnify:CR=1 FL=1